MLGIYPLNKYHCCGRILLIFRSVLPRAPAIRSFSCEEGPDIGLRGLHGQLENAPVGKVGTTYCTVSYRIVPAPVVRLRSACRRVRRRAACVGVRVCICVCGMGLAWAECTCVRVCVRVSLMVWHLLMTLVNRQVTVERECVYVCV